MKRTAFFLLFSYLICSITYAQTIRQWEILFSYYNTVKVAETDHYVFAIAKGDKISGKDTQENGGSLFRYGKEDNSIKLYSRTDGLNDREITHIGYHPNTHILLIVYKNGNIDLFGDNEVYNIPYLKNTSVINDKTINDIYFHNEYAYLSGNFGIMVIHLQKGEITDTYKLNKKVYSLCIKDNYLYAVTNEGVIKGFLKDNLLDLANWKYNPITSGMDVIEQIVQFQNTLCFRIKDKGVFYQHSSGAIQPLIQDHTIRSIKIQNNELLSFSNNKLYINRSLTQQKIVHPGIINDVASLKNDGTYWIAAGTESLKGIKETNDSKFTVLFRDTTIVQNSPKRDLSAFMTIHDGKLFVAGGGRWAERYENYGTFMIYDNKRWLNYNETTVAKEAASEYFRDVTSIAVDPKNETHYFASTWGEGLYEFKDNRCIRLYNNQNSLLGSAIGDNPHYVRIEGLCYDKENNLWMTNTEADNGNIKVLTPEGKMYSLAKEGLRNANLIDKILITSKGKKWINIPRSNPGIFVFDDNHTLENTSDDTYRFYNTFVNTADKREISSNGFFCMAEDKKRNIYIGTGNGVIICSSPDNAPEKEFLYATRITRTLDDGSLTYFLDGEQVNAIAVDGGNRKWIGTQNSGILLISEDGSETIHHFTTENSPIPSNTITAIAIDPSNGKVYIGSDKGLTAYYSDATEGSKTYSEIYAYPNPVRPEYTGLVTITGLMEDSDVKITDLNGNLIFQGKSNGGRITWNCKNRSGQRVATGVYLVMAATPDSKESAITKIAVVR